jgi:hypothetical protein
LRKEGFFHALGELDRGDGQLKEMHVFCAGQVQQHCFSDEFQGGYV